MPGALSRQPRCPTPNETARSASGAPQIKHSQPLPARCRNNSTSSALSTSGGRLDGLRDAVPTPLVEYDGFVDGDGASDLGGALTAVTQATASAGVGQYAFSAGGLESDEYETEYVPATLTVDPRPLSAVADSVTRGYLEDDPELTGVLTGVVDGDAVSAEYATGATNTSPLGTYAITANVTGAEAVLANHAITETAGVLTIEGRSAPMLVLPGRITVPAKSTTGAIVEYAATATDDVPDDLTPDCDPPSGASFAIGTTTVTERDARFPGERSSFEQRHWDKGHTRHSGENRGEMNRAY